MRGRIVTKLTTIHHRRVRGFSLVELLVVIAIVALLLAMLLPSMAGARRQAKSARVQASLRSIAAGLEMFHREQGQYPGSIRRASGVLDPDPFGAAGEPPPANKILYGAHYLARALVGRDYHGYAVPGTAPDADLYALDPPKTGRPVYSRFGPYVEPGDFQLVRDDPTAMSSLRINQADPRPADADRPGELMFLDDFGYPILYYQSYVQAQYASSICAIEDPNNPGQGAGFYDHSDNDYFTGNGRDKVGWQFRSRPHRIAVAGNFMGEGRPSGDNFLAYVFNKELWQQTAQDPERGPGRIEPYNKNSYLLISAGDDGVYGSADDVTNFR
jgi:prepilin-type N-terminal cleavage/methylation domain-containing protein